MGFAAVAGHDDLVVERRARFQQDRRALFVDDDAVWPQYLHRDRVLHRCVHQRFDAHGIAALDRFVVKALQRNAFFAVVGLDVGLDAIAVGAPAKGAHPTLLLKDGLL